MVSALGGRDHRHRHEPAPSDAQRLASKVDVIKAQEAANFYYFAMNTKNPPFDKKEVRQAIAFAIDKDSICKNVLFGISSPIDLPWPKFSRRLRHASTRACTSTTSTRRRSA